MHITSDLFLIYCFLLCFLTQHGLSIPANTFRDVRSLTTGPLSLHALDSSIDLNLPPNVTSHFQEHGFRYRVPNTYVVLKSIPFEWKDSKFRDIAWELSLFSPA